MSKVESNWRYAEQFPVETEAMSVARRNSMEMGIEPVCSSVAAQLSSISLISGARTICELGTGLGVSALALLRYNPDAHLTSIDLESEYQNDAKQVLSQAGIAASRVRMIEGDAHKVLPRLNQGAYDLLLIDADPLGLLDYVEHGLGVVRAGGSLLVPNALWRGAVPTPNNRDEVTVVFRDLLQMVADSPGIIATLSPAGDGLLTITKTAQG